MPRLADERRTAGSPEDCRRSCTRAFIAAFSSGALERSVTAIARASADVASTGRSAESSATDLAHRIPGSSAVPAPAHCSSWVHDRLNCIHLGTALVARGDSFLIVASRYPNHPDPLWHLPGGRQAPGELLAQTVVRELYEETRLSATVNDLLYVSESYDLAKQTHVTNCTFSASATGEPAISHHDAHIVGFQWAAAEALAQHITVAVVREPLIAFLSGKPSRYFGYANAGISIEFADASQSFLFR